jgi:hypothetical protein
MVTVTDVQELIEGRGLEPGEDQEPKNPTVFNIVLERFMQERGVETYDDLYAMFVDAGYGDWDLESFLDECDGTSEFLYEDFVGGVARVLGLDGEERSAFGYAYMWARKPAASVNRAGPGILLAIGFFVGQYFRKQ